MTRSEIEAEARNLAEGYTNGNISTVAQALALFPTPDAIAITAFICAEMTVMEQQRFCSTLSIHADR